MTRYGHNARLMNDVSDYQLSVDMRAQARSGRRVVMIKAAEGLGNGGAFLYRQRVRAAHEMGLRVIHYHYLHWEVAGRTQGLHLLDQIKPVWKDGDRLCADIEAPLPGNEQGSRGVAVSVAEGWAAELHRQGHTSLIGYSYRAFPQLRAIASTKAFAGWIIADYGQWRRPSIADRVALDGAPVFGRQFTDGVNGPSPHFGPGISGPCDCSWLTGAGCKLILQ
jgi:GH25 family lysozyme M1 (1,4-beta-N-acetylmuramidase)